jgi:hypothetical protein
MWLTHFLAVTWTNPDNTQVQPSLIYDTVLNALTFTANPNGLSSDTQIPVVRVPSSPPFFTLLS